MSGSRYYGGNSNSNYNSYNSYSTPRGRPLSSQNYDYPSNSSDSDDNDCPRVTAARERARAQQQQQQQDPGLSTQVSVRIQPSSQRYYAQQRFVDRDGVQHTRSLQLQYTHTHTRSGPTQTQTQTQTQDRARNDASEQQLQHYSRHPESDGSRYPAETTPRATSPPYTSARSRPSAWERSLRRQRLLAAPPPPPTDVDVVRLVRDARS